MSDNITQSNLIKAVRVGLSLLICVLLHGRMSMSAAGVRAHTDKINTERRSSCKSGSRSTGWVSALLDSQALAHNVQTVLCAVFHTFMAIYLPHLLL